MLTFSFLVFSQLRTGWHAFKKLGANIALRKAMRVKSIFYLLQKFNFFFLVGFCVLIVQMRRQSHLILQTLDIILPSLSVTFIHLCFVTKIPNRCEFIGSELLDSIVLT
jgi:hypothetical protein